MCSRRESLAAMCHAILPRCMETDRCTGWCSQKAKYLTCILPEMVQVFLNNSVPLTDIETGVFGGARVLFASCSQDFTLTVGWQNIRAGLSQLQEMGMKVSMRNLGGTVGRKMQFETATGRVVVKKHGGLLVGKRDDGQR